MTTKFRAKGNETMHWLDKAGVMVTFKNGVAEVADKKVADEMIKHGYMQDFAGTTTSTVKTTLK